MGHDVMVAQGILVPLAEVRILVSQQNIYLSNMNYEQLLKLLNKLTVFVKDNPRVFATSQRLIDAKLVNTYKDGITLMNIFKSKNQTLEQRIENTVLSIILYRYSETTVLENVYGDKCTISYIIKRFCKNNEKGIDIRDKRYALRRFLFERI